MNRPLINFVLLFALFLGGCRTRAPLSSPLPNAAPAIRAVLEMQAAQWNRGDIGAFMDTYVRSDKLRFSSGDVTRRGWETTFERYVTRYPTPEAMGQLRFEDLEVLVLSPEWAEAFGRFRLKRGGDYPDTTGLFTLLLQQTEEGWRIVHDHTSAAEQ